jgi:hypothetical protein
MSENVVIALIAAVPPTLAAIAALWQVRRIAQPIHDVNRAVNHRTPGQRRLIEVVDDIHAETHALRDDLTDLRRELDRHRAWHDNQQEDDE